MFRIALASEDSFLFLAPRWSGWGEFGQVAALAALLLAPLVLIVGLYRYEMKLIARRSAGLLLLLRSLGLVSIWSVAGLQPTVAHTQREEMPSRVLVAVDLSASMDLTDPQRTWAEKVRLAQALQLASDATPWARWLEVADQGVPMRGVELSRRGDTRRGRVTRKKWARWARSRGASAADL